MGVTQTLRGAARRAGRATGSVVRVQTERPELVLTYDDGPDEETTAAILDVLAQHGATATFFVLLTRVREQPELLREIVARGHEIGLHGTDHRRMTTIGRREARARLVDGRAELEGAAGTPVRWYRPPYGAQTLSDVAGGTRGGADAGAVGAQPPRLEGPHRPSSGSPPHARARGRAPSCWGMTASPPSATGCPTGPRPVFDRGEFAEQVLDQYAAPRACVPVTR